MRILPVVFVWRELSVVDDDGIVQRRRVMDPLARYDNVAKRQYRPDEEYTLVEAEARSRKSHNAYFAQVESAFDNLPENLAARWPTSEHMRKWVLIETGWFDEKEFEYEGNNAYTHAKRLGTWIRTEDEFARISIHRVSAVLVKVIVKRAKSQSYQAMPDKETFEKSKADVLGWLEHAIGVESGTLKREAGMSA